MTKVYNIYHRDAPTDAIYVGRPTIVGNPYSHVVSTRKRPSLANIIVESREEAVKSYRKYFYESLKVNKEFRDFVMSLQGHDLVCWCAPKPCHADVIAEYLDSL